MTSNLVNKGSSDFRNQNEENASVRSARITANPNNEIKLQDIEDQLEMAETRCNNLKDQLDYMKTKYVNKPTSKSRKVSNLNLERKAHGDSANYSDDSLNNAITTISKAIPRQKSNAIGTDNTGAAVRTINNILNGITNSVNRLSEIHSNMAETPRPRVVSVALSPRPSKQEITEPKKKSLEVLPSLAVDSCTIIKSRIRTQKRKTKNPTSRNIKSCSKHTIKGTSHKVEKKTKNNTYSKSLMLEKRSSTLLKKKYFNKLTPNNLVEIYHNDAVKNSDSDEFHPKKNAGQKTSNTEQKEVPPLEMEVCPRKLPEGYSDCQQIQSRLKAIDSKGNKFLYDPPEAPRTLSCCYSRNYELPTVASKMKQVAKSYMGNFNFKAIPFCAATSITQSHNIGINIQQVMNIIKNRQAINGISPTLAHNIGLAADKMHNKPFSDIVSSINSKLGVTNSKCPLSSGYYNLQILQEQAKTIPEEDIQEVEEENIESPQVNTVIITGPSGDVEIKNRKTTNWAAEMSNNDQCTCVIQPNVGAYKISNRLTNKITTNRTVIEPTATVQSQMLESPPNQTRPKISKYSNIKSRYMPKSCTQQQIRTVSQIVEQVEQPSIENSEQVEADTPLKGKERTLKEVLMNLHSDFEELNKKYEDLSQKTNSDGNQEAVQELEQLEAKLSKKEEEITMVMTLYKEVLALKYQVKTLREKKSQASIPVVKDKETRQRFKEYNNPEAAFHLTKLLRQIQHYQRRYKSNSGSDYE